MMRMIFLALAAVMPACTVVQREVVYVVERPVAAPAEAAPAVEKPLVLKGQPVVLTTAAFESGEMTLGEAKSAELEAFLQDLNRRKDFDYAQNGGQPGPHSAYLWEWVQRVVGELRGRGYYFDESGNFFTGAGQAVALR